MAEERDAHATRGPFTTARALLWTSGSAVLPGIAHLRTGRRWLGGTLLGLFVALVAFAVTALVILLGADVAESARMAVQPRWLIGAGAGAFLVAVVWMTVILHSYTITKPRTVSWPGRIIAGVVVTALCAMVAAPAGAVLYTSYTAYDMFDTVFETGSDEEPHDDTDPWAGKDRVTMLLLGSDNADNRYGTRTDSMMAASVDVEYGDVVLIGLPRNLENVPFPEGSALAERYPPPYSFDGLLNDVYQTVADAPRELAIDPSAKNPAADTLKRTISHAIGLELDYYALVDMRGFEDLVDAIGGVTVRIEDPIPYGQQGGVLDAGRQHLDGHEALWYGRSRTNSDDYSRMGRQGCLVQAIAEQTDPSTILTGFRELAGATKRTVETDIPQPKVPHLIDVAQLAKDGSMRTLQLSPPQVNTARPDWEKIRELVATAVREQEAEQTRPPGGGERPTSEPSSSPSAGEEGAETPPEERAEHQWEDGSPYVSPTAPGRQVGDEATSLDELCP